MELIDITNLTDEQLEALLRNVTEEKENRNAEKFVKAEETFYNAARALYAIAPDYEFSIYEDDLKYAEKGCVTLELLLRESGNLIPQN